ncbi:hypothetical protein PTI98_008780 [Pleurotus ostreatus]|nr:hypothetical protein PTI98_009400 [Pleurotus ostreatus]KAJ8692078.1 hypothetical protein PTI98_009419 [Pleurotus ostreatus]KAJ8693798.1 hypothetical protein PTI98_008755 [Pleurotus ostreatus]KAJ8693823.1 hypothetical protein PTI98_008780 [Pleurotus ostreatus]
MAACLKKSCKNEDEALLSEMKKALTCGICDEIMEGPCMLPCGHIFCEECLVAKFREKIINVLSGMDMLYILDRIGGDAKTFTAYTELKKSMYWEEADKVFLQTCPDCGQEVGSCPAPVWPMRFIIGRLGWENLIERRKVTLPCSLASLFGPCHYEA